MTTVQFVLAIFIGVLVVFLPGLPIALALRLRGLWLAAAMPAFGLTAIVAAAIVADWLSLRWSYLVVLGMSIVGAIVVWCTTRFIPSMRAVKHPHETRSLVPLAAVAIGGLLLAIRFAYGIGAPEFFAQAGDNIYHLNAVQLIVDGGSSSPFSAGRFDDSTSPLAFYPSAWHAAVALIAQLSGGTIPIASNATLFIFSCAIWPLGAVLLTRTVFGNNSITTLFAGALTAAFGAFPFHQIAYMGTYPLVGSVALLPVALASVFEISRVGRRWLGAGAGTVSLACIVPGLAVMHPSALLMLTVLSLPPVGAAAWQFARSRPHLRRLAALILLLAAIATFAAIVFIRPNYAQELSWRGTLAQGIGEVITHSLAGVPINLLVGTLATIGIIVAIRRGTRAACAAVATWVLVSCIYLAAAGQDEFLRLLIAGPWYADATRVAAFSPIAVLPLAAFGGAISARWIARRPIIRSRLSQRRARAVLVPAVAVLMCALIILSPATRVVDGWMRRAFLPTDNPFTATVGVGPDERAVLAKVDEIVPIDDLIAGSPRDGSSFAYALTGRRVLINSFLEVVTPLKQAFLDGFATADSKDPACAAARDLGVKWILEFHPDELLANAGFNPGLQNLDQSRNAELVYRSGGSALYKVTGCGVA